MSQLFFTLLLVAVCPVMMFVMMRGMHGGHGPAAGPAPKVIDAASTDTRIAELEREVARLRETTPADPVSAGAPPR